MTYRYTVKCPKCDKFSEYSGYKTKDLTKTRNLICGHCGLAIVNCENLSKNEIARIDYHNNI